MNKRLWSDALDGVDQKYIDRAAEQFRSGRNKSNVVEITFTEKPAAQVPVSRTRKVLTAVVSVAAAAALFVGGGFIADYVNRNKVPIDGKPTVSQAASSGESVSSTPQTESADESGGNNAVPAVTDVLALPEGETIEYEYYGEALFTETEPDYYGGYVNTAASADGKSYFYITQVKTIYDGKSSDVISIIPDDGDLPIKSYRSNNIESLYAGSECLSSSFYFTESGPVYLSVLTDSYSDCPVYHLVYFDNEMNVLKVCCFSSKIPFVGNHSDYVSELYASRLFNLSDNGRYLIEYSYGGLINIFDIENGAEPDSRISDILNISYNNDGINDIFDLFNYITISNDGNKIFAIGTYTLSDAESLKTKYDLAYIDLSAETPTAYMLKENIDISKIIYSSPGDLFAFIKDGRIDFTTSQSTWTLAAELEEGEKIYNTFISPNRKYVVILSGIDESVNLYDEDYSKLQLFDYSEGNVKQVYNMPFSSISSVSVSDNGTVFAVLENGGRVAVPINIVYNGNSGEVMQPIAAEQAILVAPLADCSLITADFGYDKFMGSGHSGIDIACEVGTEVHAAADGIVLSINDDEKSNTGRQVIIKHDDGMETVYNHLSEIRVKPGQKVGSGDVIALSGNTGFSTGPHLHFEVIKYGENVNPMDYIVFGN